MRGRSARRTAAVLASLVGSALAVGGVANAYWGGNGGGAGASGSGTALDVTLTPATAADGLYPGGTADVALRISNPNPAQVRIGGLGLDTTEGDGGFAVDDDHTACTPLSVLTLTDRTDGWVVPARIGVVDGELAVTVADALTMSTAAANACQGATFTVYLTVHS